MAKKPSPILPSKSETKAERTTAFAMTLIQKETDARHAKTQRLRAARLEQEAAQKKEAPTPPSKRKATPKKPTGS